VVAKTRRDEGATTYSQNAVRFLLSPIGGGLENASTSGWAGRLRTELRLKQSRD